MRAKKILGYEIERKPLFYKGFGVVWILWDF